jgi:hypothetical protein
MDLNILVRIQNGEKKTENTERGQMTPLRAYPITSYGYFKRLFPFEIRKFKSKINQYSFQIF